MRQWTAEQLDAITARERSVIVSAAAGSGKTSVVERLIRIIADRDNPVPVEKMIVVTFTNDAAAEMKQRLSVSLSGLINDRPFDKWLSRQHAMLGNASISTIHSFCFDLIRDNINMLSLASDFRIIDETEENGEKCGTAYLIKAKKVLCATGGAAGLYKPNNPGFSRHKMWYPPFNTGAGYAMGIKAGAEMTTFEMRFIALRCKDTIAPTGTLAQGAGAKQINSLGEVYETKYGLTTSERVYGTVNENIEGRGPCYLRTEGISQEASEDLKKAYLNMAPSQTLKWIESGKNPSEQNVEIEGTEPYIVGGHTASGYWVDTKRRTTVKGLYAAGDVAGGCPQKYVTGALAEGEIAALTAISELGELSAIDESDIERHLSEVTDFLYGNTDGTFTTEQLEEAMQTVMDSYAGGIKTNYRFNEKQLDIADTKIRQIYQLSEKLHAEDFQELMYIYELRERLVVARSVIAHLKARKETRWHSFAENLDYPNKDNENFNKYVNSRLKDGEIEIILRDLVEGGRTYEHND